jgi:regulator of replication initiation timing
MSEKLVIPDEVVISKIYFIREKKVMLDNDLAELYGVETRMLNQQIKRNEYRFPEDFIFQLTQEEYSQLKTQKAASNWGGRRKLPYVFTEHGVLMLSSVLNSKKAVEVKIQIMRIFTKIRQMFLDNTELRLEIEHIKKKVDNQSKNIELVFQYLDELIEKQEKQQPRKQISFKPGNRNSSANLRQKTNIDFPNWV